METTSIVLSTIFTFLATTSLFIAYYFSLSKNGELRRIMIAKHYCLAFMFIVLGMVNWWPQPNKLFTIIACIPYMLSIAWLIKYLTQTTK